MKNACAYIRVSTNNQVELSPDTQRQMIYDYCKKNGYIISDNDIFMDLGISGKKAEKRPQFNYMISCCKSKDHPYDAVIVWKFSRFARNQEESVIYKRMLRKNDVEVISISEPISDDIGGRIAESIFEIMDEYYSINLSQEVMRGMKESAKRGNHLSKPPYGYNKDGNGNLIIEPKEAEIIKQIFDMKMNGLGIFTIAKTLNQQNISFGRKKKFYTSDINYILDNPIYCGRIRWNYSDHSGNAKYKNEEEWIISKGKHEPIISEDIFDKIAAEKKPYKQVGSRSKYNYKHWLGGIVECKCCGKKYIFENSSIKKGTNTTYSYYMCNGARNGDCDTKRIRVEKLEKYIFEYLESIVDTNGEFINISTDIDINQDIAENIKQSIKSLDKKMERIKEAYRNGIDTLEEYKENKEILMKEKEKLEGKISNISNTETTSQRIEKTSNLIEILKDESISVSDKNENIKKVIQKIVYDPYRENMEFYFL